MNTRNLPIHLKRQPKDLPPVAIRLFWVIGVIAVVDSLLLAVSTVQIILCAMLLALGVFWLLARRTVHISISRFLMKTVAGLIIVTLVFGGFQFFVFTTSGYPSTEVPQVMYPNVLNASLTQYLDSVEQSGSFQLLQTNHVGTLTFERLELRSYNQGEVTWTFRATDTNTRILIGNIGGRQYLTSFDGLPSLFFPILPTPPNELTLKETREQFQTIDNLGLNWFLNKGIELYQNQTVPKPEVAFINVYLGVDSVGGYEGLALSMVAAGSGQGVNGTIPFPTLFIAEFQPNGTLLSYTRR